MSEFSDQSKNLGNKISLDLSACSAVVTSVEFSPVNLIDLNSLEKDSTASALAPTVVTPLVRQHLEELGLSGFLRHLEDDLSSSTLGAESAVLPWVRQEWKDFWQSKGKNEVIPLEALETAYKISNREKVYRTTDWNALLAKKVGSPAYKKLRNWAEQIIELRKYPDIPAEFDPRKSQWHSEIHPIFENRDKTGEPHTRLKADRRTASALDEKYGTKGPYIINLDRRVCKCCHRKGHTVEFCPEIKPDLPMPTEASEKLVTFLRKLKLTPLDPFVGEELESILQLPERVSKWKKRVREVRKKWFQETGISPDEIFREVDLCFYPQSRRNALWHWATMEGVNLPFLLDIVQGYKVKWLRSGGPPKFEFKNTASMVEHKEFLDKEIPRLQKQGILIPVPESLVKYVYLVHVVEGAKKRIIVDGSPQNHYSPKISVRMVTRNEVLLAVEPGSWVFDWDTKDAFYSIHAHPDQALWNCIRRVVNKVKLYWALFGRPMGSNDSPWDYCRGQQLIQKMLKSWGIRVEMFMDDQFCQTPPNSLLFCAIRNTVTWVLNALFILCKKEKTHMNMYRSVWDFLGMTLDSQNLTVKASVRNREKTIRLLTETLKHKELTIEQMQKVHGKLLSLKESIQHMPILITAFQNQLSSLVRLYTSDPKINGRIKAKLSKGSRLELQFIMDNYDSLDGSPLWYGVWDVDIWTDASDYQIGIHSRDSLMKVTFPSILKEKSSLLREAVGLLFGMVNNLHQLKNKRVRFISDNLGLITGWERNGVSVSQVQSIMQLTKAIALAYNVTFWTRWKRRSTYGAVLADRLSKASDRQEWSINLDILRVTLSHFGLPWPQMDAFAAENCAVTTTYSSQFADGTNVLTNAVSNFSFRKFPWQEYFVFANPPFDDRVVGEWLELIAVRNIRCICVLPSWTSRVWWHTLMLQAQIVVILPRHVENFTPPKKWSYRTKTPKWDCVFTIHNLSKNEWRYPSKWFEFHHSDKKIRPTSFAKACAKYSLD